MRFLRCGPRGKEKPAVLDKNNKIRDLSSYVSDLNPENINFKILEKLKEIDLTKLPEIPKSTRIGSCINKPGKFIGIGLNYSDHAKETEWTAPEEPIVFFKSNSSISGPNDDVYLPIGSKKSDWEVELGVVIGKEAKYVSEDQAQEYIAGYCVVNDLSERAFQLEHSGQWVKGKSCDTFGPIGPYIMTVDEIQDYQKLNMYLEVNGKRMQDGSTKTMVYGVNFLISYLSRFMSLQPGDIISTGTPPGVGMGMKPQVFLKPGDVMKLGIEGLGEQTQKTVAA